MQKEKILSREYMEKNYSKDYERFKKTLKRIKSDSLRIKMEEYYLYIVSEKYHYNYDSIHNITMHLCHYINEINHPDIEYYIEYCLEYYKENFQMIFYSIYCLILKTNLALRDICSNYLRYCGKNDKEKLFNDIYGNSSWYNEEEELCQIMNAIIEIEKKHILDCYKKAKNKDTFCENCIPMCWVREEKKGKKLKKYKRTVPFRF